MHIYIYIYICIYIYIHTHNNNNNNNNTQNIVLDLTNCTSHNNLHVATENINIFYISCVCFFHCISSNLFKSCKPLNVNIFAAQILFSLPSLFIFINLHYHNFTESVK